MPGAQKNRILNERRAAAPASSHGSSNGDASSSGKATHSAPSVTSHAPTARTAKSERGNFDGNADPSDPSERDPNKSKTTVENKNIDLGMAAYAVGRGQDVSTTMPARPPPSKLGSAQKIALNTFHVLKYPTIPIYQFDVIIGTGAEKRGLITKVWQSKAVQDAVGVETIFDGNKLAWSGKKIDHELRINVDLDAEQGRAPKPGKGPEIHRVVIRQTNKVRIDNLQEFLKGKCSFDNSCLEAINFFDHLLRYTPSKTYTSIKRAFFQKGEKRFDLGGGVEAFKGVYQSLRMAHPGALSINLDVANGTFWTAQPLVKAAVLLCGARNDSDLVIGLQKSGESGRMGKELKKMRKIHVVAAHRGKGTQDGYVIEKFIYESAKKKMVTISDPSGGEKKMSVFEYFSHKYNIRLSYPELPLVKMTRGQNTILPMEVLSIKENQRYQFKMDERQTSNMIKFAVTAPPQRWTDIEHGLKMLSWNNDPVLKKYEMQISQNKTVVDARLIPAPTVKFGQGDAKPGVSGRWELKGKKFLQSNSAPLKAWAVCVISGRRGGKPDKSVIEAFIADFVKGYKNHGGKVENSQPAMALAAGDDVGAWVTQAWNAAGNQAQARPQILFFILPDKDSTNYGRIKRSCECRYGVVSQCVQYSHVQKKAPQYISNVCMKFNAKLGGATCRAAGPKTPNGVFQHPTMVIGGDVSHSAPGVQAPSMAALTCSIDKAATRYAALVQTNGYRVEMINTDIIMNELKELVKHWMQHVNSGKVPSVIFYIRDGVSEGQYQHVLQQEVADMKNLLKGPDPTGSTKFVVLVGSKRHHVRFWPEKGDKNGNAHPGTLVETGVTHPFENDFYLQAHAALKGTARPVHYHVLLNEANYPNEMLQTMLYEQSYQYQRATTPISQHPAIYYAHLASNRAVPHDPKWSGSSDSGPSTSSKPTGSGSQGKSAGNTGSSSGVPTDFEKLMPMPNQGGINTSMWYI